MRPTLNWWAVAGKPSHAALQRDEGRHALEGAWLRPKKKPREWILQVTNSLVMVSIPVTVDNDLDLRVRAEASGDGIFLPLEALYELERRKNRTDNVAYFEEDGSVTVGDITYHLPSDWRYENEKGFPGQPSPMKRPNTFKPKQKDTYTINLDPKLLSSLAYALGAKNGVFITVDLTETNQAVMVHSNSDKNADGLLMPLRMNPE